jgi:hypothetical protein
VQIFAKRFWGFDPARWPVISFHLEGNRDALLCASKFGDRVVFVGTQTEPTDRSERGRLLGMAEIGFIEIETEEVVDRRTLEPWCFDKDERIRWPKALPMLRAWRFLNPPLVTDVLREQLPYEATIRAVLLDAADTAAVLALPCEEVPVPEQPVIANQRRLYDALHAAGATTGPRPTSWAGETGRNAEEPSFTYAFQFGNRECWKIGHARDIGERLAEVNKHLPHEIGCELWQDRYKQRWLTEVDAYEMEQRVLAILRKPDSVGERVCCTKRELERAWTTAIMPRQSHETEKQFVKRDRFRP